MVNGTIPGPLCQGKTAFRRHNSAEEAIIPEIACDIASDICYHLHANQWGDDPPEVNAVPVISPRTKAKKPRKMIKMLALYGLMLAITGVSVSHGTYNTPAATAEEEAPMNIRKGRTVMYVMDSPNLKLRDSDAQGLDQLNYSFGLI